MLKREAAFIMAEDIFVAALTAHPYTIANLLVSLERTKAWIAVLADEGPRRWWLYGNVGVVVLPEDLRAGVR